MLRDVKYTADGRIKYRLAFQHARWRNSDDFAANHVYAIGDSMIVDDNGKPTTWWVSDLLDKPEGEPDTLVLTSSKP